MSMDLCHYCRERVGFWLDWMIAHGLRTPKTASP